VTAAPPTLGEWLLERSENVPPELEERIRFMVRELIDEPIQGIESIDALAAVAKTQLQRLLQTGVISREVALDLLSIDAIATYSLEIAASAQIDLSASAASVMQAIASVMESQDPNLL